MSKKKTVKRRRVRVPHPDPLVQSSQDDFVYREARASVALDGETQFCLSCEMGETAKHTCGLRPMSAEEMAVVEAAMKFDRHGYGSLELSAACRALRAAREGKRQ